MSLPALAPYIHEIRSRYKRLSDMSAYLQGAPPIPPEAAVPAVPAEVASSSGRRSRKAPPVPPVPATSSAVHTTVPTSSRGQDPDLMDAARSSKKRKTVPPNVANGKSAPIGRTGRAPPTANGAVPASGKRRDDGFAYGAEAPGQPTVWSSDRASLGNGARAFGSERGAPRNRISKGGRDGDDDHDQRRAHRVADRHGQRVAPVGGPGLLQGGEDLELRIDVRFIVHGAGSRAGRKGMGTSVHRWPMGRRGLSTDRNQSCLA